MKLNNVASLRDNHPGWVESLVHHPFNTFYYWDLMLHYTLTRERNDGNDETAELTFKRVT